MNARIRQVSNSNRVPSYSYISNDWNHGGIVSPAGHESNHARARRCQRDETSNA